MGCFSLNCYGSLSETAHKFHLSKLTTMKPASILVTLFAVCALSFVLLRINKKQAIVKQYIYSYKSKGVGYSDMESLYSGDSTRSNSDFLSRKTLQQTSVNITCDIKKTVLMEGTTDQWVCFQIMNPALTIRNNGQRMDTKMMQDELVRPVFVRLSKTGKMKTIKTDTAVSYATISILKDILTRFQFVLPYKRLNTWQATEENSLGSFRAKYQLVNCRNAGREYRKTNEGYTQLKTTLKNQNISTSCTTVVRTDTLYNIQKVDEFEVRTCRFPTDTLSISGNKVSIVLKSLIAAGEDELSAINELNHSANYSLEKALSTSLTDEEINRLAYKHSLANSNWKTLIQKLKTTNEQDNKTEEELVLKFRALAYLFPQQCKNISLMLQEEPYGTAGFRVLFKALAYTETPSAINALIDVIKNRRKAEPVLLEILPIIAVTKSPTTEAVETIKELAMDASNSEAVVSTAQLALGGLAYNFKTINPSVTEELTTYLIKNPVRTDTVQYLLVLGNTGSPAVLPVLKAYIDSKKASEKVRSTAITAMRLIEKKEVDLILRKMSSNRNNQIKKAAMETIAFREQFFQTVPFA